MLCIIALSPRFLRCSASIDRVREWTAVGRRLPRTHDNFSKGLPTLRQIIKLLRHCHECLTTQPFPQPCASSTADLSPQVGLRMYCLQKAAPRELLSRNPSFPPQTTSGCLTPFHTAVIRSSQQLNMAVVARTILPHPVQC